MDLLKILMWQNVTVLDRKPRERERERLQKQSDHYRYHGAHMHAHTHTHTHTTVCARKCTKQSQDCGQLLLEKSHTWFGKISHGNSAGILASLLTVAAKDVSGSLGVTTLQELLQKILQQDLFNKDKTEGTMNLLLHHQLNTASVCTPRGETVLKQSCPQMQVPSVFLFCVNDNSNVCSLNH